MPILPRSVSARWALHAVAALVGAFVATATDLYLEEFESFPTGFDTLVGNGGWQGNAVGMQVHGVAEVTNTFLGQSAYIGPTLPTGGSGITLVYAERPIGYDPVANGTPTVVVSIVLGIADSNIPAIRRDNFFVTFLNSVGQVLGRVNFDNTDETFGIYRVQGNIATFTGFDFIRNEIHELSLEIDFAANTWSGSLDGFPIFSGAPFAAPETSPLDFGVLAFDWQITETDDGPIDPSGDNWLLFDDIISSVPTPLFQASPTLAPGQPPGLTFFTEPGHTYQVFHSDDLTTWLDDLPGSTIIPRGMPALTTFSDPSAPAPAFRSYRVRRTEDE